MATLKQEKPDDGSEPEKYWFRAKRFGWGWEPVTWQGWLLILIYAGLIAFIILNRDVTNTPDDYFVKQILPELVVVTILFVAIAWRNCEKPRWQWGGKRSTNDENEDSWDRDV